MTITINDYCSMYLAYTGFTCRLNRLCELPRGFGSFPALAILDLTYNNLTSSSFSANFSYLGGELCTKSCCTRKNGCLWSVIVVHMYLDYSSMIVTNQIE